MSKVIVKIKGLKPILKNLANSPKIIQIEGDKAISKSIFLIQGSATALTPVAKPWTWKNPVRGYVGGNLRRSWITAFRPLRGVLANTAGYAGYVHEGTRYMKKRPFLTKGINRVKSVIESIWQDLGDRIVNDFAKK